jgi:hypothetical protein
MSDLIRIYILNLLGQSVRFISWKEKGLAKFETVPTNVRSSLTCCGRLVRKFNLRSAVSRANVLLPGTFRELVCCLLVRAFCYRSIFFLPAWEPL